MQTNTDFVEFSKSLNTHSVRYVVVGGYAPNRIDINTSITNVEFGDAFPRRSESTYGGVPVAYLSVADLLKNKEAVARDKDLLDVKLLRKLPTK